jgi:hypothetical protein
VSDDLNYSNLDPGIRDVVRLLRERGFNTTDSGDGVSKVAKHGPMDGVLPFPHVVALLDEETMISETKRLGRLALEIGSEWHVEMSWSPGGPAVAMLIGPEREDGI